MNRTRRERQVYAICAGCGKALDPMDLSCPACGAVVPVGAPHRHQRHAARRVVMAAVLVLALAAVLVAAWQLR